MIMNITVLSTCIEMPILHDHAHLVFKLFFIAYANCSNVMTAWSIVLQNYSA